MSIFAKLFGKKYPDKYTYSHAMIEMASESERTYRGMIETYNECLNLPEFSDVRRYPVEATGRGIYKARLFGALFMVYAYSQSNASKEEINEMANAATGSALLTLQGPDEPYLEREEARAMTVDLLKSTYVSIVKAFDTPPMVPGGLLPEHITLAECLHDALAESIGYELYTQVARKRLEVIVQVNVAMAMNQARRWIF